MSSHTCLACRVVFSTFELARVHYQSEFHRYNLKRAIAELPPVKFADFEAKAAQLQSASAGEKPAVDENELRCEPCHKTFSSLAAKHNHCASKKHQQMVARRSIDEVTPKGSVKESVDDDDAWTDVSDEEDLDKNAIEPTQCLFCGVLHDNAKANLEHMVASHSFYIPDSEYLSDAEGLLVYLGYKVGVGCECVQCSRHFHSIDAVRKHMKDKGHVVVHNDAPDMLDFYEYGEVSDEDETEDSAVEEALNNDWELQLPSGATIGHRALRHVYKQRLRPLTRALVPLTVEERQTSLVQKLMKESRQNHVMPLQLSRDMARKRARDQRFMRAQIARAQQQLGVKTNKLHVFEGR